MDNRAGPKLLDVPLPILKIVTTSQTDLIRYFNQAQLLWAGQLGEETTLDYGRWIPQTGSLLDAFLSPNCDASQIIQQTTALAFDNKVAWNTCSINPAMPTHQTTPLVDALLSAGWKPDPLQVLYRPLGKSSPPVHLPDLKVIPARASYRHFTQLMQQQGDVESALLHLDDSHLDALLALKTDQAVGSIGLQTSGQVGTIRQWYVAPASRNAGIGRMLLQRAIEISSRAGLPHLMIGLHPNADSARSLAAHEGFQPVGQWLNYRKIV